MTSATAPSPVRPQAYRFVRLGDVKPAGWLAAQLARDLEHGFVGCLDELAPDLIQRDDIYGADRLTKAVRNKELGVLAKESRWEVQFLWWNSETQSNWLDGMARAAVLLDHPHCLAKARARIERLLATQDAGGYLGIYAPDLRFDFSGENGELWAQASLLRVLFGWYEATGDARALEAVRRAVAVTMQAYPIRQAHPFAVTGDYAGVGHGLIFTDVLDQLHHLTGDQRYLDYALWLYREYSRQPLSQDDIQLACLLDPERRFHAHGVHTYEHLRSLLTAVYAGDDPRMDAALAAYLAKLEICLTPSGGPIGDEHIAGRLADASETGYEYCSIHELLDSYTHLLQKTGAAQWADRAEWLFFNAAQGARHPTQPAVAYLKTDNSYSMTGPLHPGDAQDAHNPQFRYKYSPVHQDVAVCCVPNAGRILPCYVNSMWLRSAGGLAAALYGASDLRTQVDGVDVHIAQVTDYPFDLSVTFRLTTAQPVAFTLSLRRPAWASGLALAGADSAVESDGWVHVRKTWSSGDQLALRFEADVTCHRWTNGKGFISYGPLLFALPLAGNARGGREYRPGFADRYYDLAAPVPDLALPRSLLFSVEHHGFDPHHPWGSLVLAGELLDAASGAARPVRLVPLGGTILRRVTFPMRASGESA
jgi:hypothetical protein